MANGTDIVVFLPGSMEPMSLDEAEERVRALETDWIDGVDSADDAPPPSWDISIDKVKFGFALIRAESSRASRYASAYHRTTAVVDTLVTGLLAVQDDPEELRRSLQRACAVWKRQRGEIKEETE